MEKIISYTIGTEGIFPEDIVCGGVQGDHRATAVEITPTIELAERLGVITSEGKKTELRFEAFTASGEQVGYEHRTGEDLFVPFYLTGQMTSSGLDLVVIVRLFVVGESTAEICKGIIKLYFTPCPAHEYIGCSVPTDAEDLKKEAEDILAELKETAEHYDEIMDSKLVKTTVAAETAARHLKRVEEIAEEAENTKVTLENGMEIFVIGGGADNQTVAIPDDDGRLKMMGKFAYREDTYQNWFDKNPLLLRGEVSVVSDARDEKWLKIGDGKTLWRDLDWKLGPKGERGETGPQGEKGEKGDQGEKGDNADIDEWVQIADVTTTENTVINITTDMEGNSFAVKKFIAVVTKSAVEGNTATNVLWVKAKNADKTSYTPLVGVEGGKAYADNVPSMWRYEGEIKHAWQTSFRCGQEQTINTLYPYGEYVIKYGVRSEFRNSRSPVTAFQFTWGYSGALPAGTRVEIWGVRA